MFTPTPNTVNQNNQLQIIKYNKKKSDWKQIAAVCQFLYRGYQISISTNGDSPETSQGPVAIFGGVHFKVLLRDRFVTVEECIKWIDLHSSNGTKPIFVKKEGHVLSLHGGKGPVHREATELDVSERIQEKQSYMYETR